MTRDWRQRSEAAKTRRHLYKRAAWRAIKDRHKIENPICHLCEAEGKAVIANVVNHRVAHKGDEGLFFDFANTEHICKPHHDGYIAQQERGGYAGACGLDGFPTDPAHPANKGTI